MQTALVPVMEINNLTRLDKLFIRCSEPCEVCQLREIDVVVVSRAVTTVSAIRQLFRSTAWLGLPLKALLTLVPISLISVRDCDLSITVYKRRL